jgi:hypothetical protein
MVSTMRPQSIRFISHVYEGLYRGNVVVRVRAKSGLISLATATVFVVPPVEQHPGTPVNLRAKAGNGSVTLTWAAVPGPPASWFTIRDGVGNVLDRVAANPDGSPPADWTFEELTSGTAYQFSVSAGNERGESAADGPVSATPQAPSNPITTGGNLPLVTHQPPARFGVLGTKVVGSSGFDRPNLAFDVVRVEGKGAVGCKTGTPHGRCCSPRGWTSAG